MLSWVGTTVRVGNRSRQIAYGFYRHGLAGSLSALGIEVGKRGLRITGLRQSNSTPFDEVLGHNLAKTFAYLGPTFIKLGQVLATRPDLVGDRVAESLKVLFDRVPSIPFRKIEKILKQELGYLRYKKSFRSIDNDPLASASISQTHRAVLADYTPVILKVQKTGVGEKVRADLLIIEGIIKPLDKLYPKLSLGHVFKDFKEATLREIDYREEAKNIDRFRKNYNGLFQNSDITFPRYYPELTTERVIALEPMHGKKFHELKKGSTVARQAASMSLASVLEQIFDHGFFHADPHAGNLFFMEDEGRLGFIDLGLVGQLDPKDKKKFLKVLLAVLKRDRDRLAQSLFELGTSSKKTNFDDFNKDVQALLDEMKSIGPQNLRLEPMVNKLLSIARKHGVHIPNRYVMMIRSCLVIEGVAKGLDPNLSIVQVATPIVAKSLLKSASPFGFIRRMF